MNDFSKSLIALGKRQFESEILPQIKDKGLADKILVYMCGSVSLGLADENSDIDFDVLVSEKLTDEEYAICEDILGKDYFYESKRVSYGFDLKKSLGRYLRGERRNYWEDFNPYNLHDINHYIPVLDTKFRLTELRKELGFYPKEIFTSVVRGLWITMNDGGEYNSFQCFQRGDECGADIYFGRGVEALLRMVFVLNGQYYPPTKWLNASMINIDNKFGVENLLCVGNIQFEEKRKLFMNSYNLVADFLKENKILEKECVDNFGLNFSKEYFVFETF